MRLSPHDVALVTGGASGLGLATARALAAEGARVVIADPVTNAPGLFETPTLTGAIRMAPR